MDNERNIWIVEIVCATGYKLSEICYVTQAEAIKYAKSQVGERASKVNNVWITTDETIFRVRPLMLKM